MLTDARRNKDDEIARNSSINLSLADPSSQKYVSLTGNAVVSNDRAKIKGAVFHTGQGMMGQCGGSKYPRVKVKPDDAEFWDSPGTVISYAKMAVSAVTGTRSEIGENRKLSM